MVPKSAVEVIGLHGANFQAMIDTGFTGFLCIPAKAAEKLGLVYVGQECFELGNGQGLTQYYFRAKIRFLGHTQDADILLTNSEVPQIGVALLADCKMTIDFLTNQVKITRKKI